MSARPLIQRELAHMGRRKLHYLLRMLFLIVPTAVVWIAMLGLDGGSREETGRTIP